MPMKRNPTILALDPGLRDLGYAVLSGKRLLEANVLPLRAHPADRRLGIAKEALKGWIRAHRPGAIVWESAPRHSHLGHARVHRLIRSAEILALRRRMKAAAYSAKTVRQSVVGDGWATKPEVAKVICARFPELRVYVGHDRKWKAAYWHNLFDAVALALHHQLVSKPPSRSR
jgi:Holliday junction resolvasome RuvABC endonuclease subunit